MTILSLTGSIFLSLRLKKGEILMTEKETQIRLAILIFLTAVSVSLVIIIFTLLFSNGEKTSAQEPVTDAAAVSEIYQTYTVATTTTPPGYIMKTHEGVVALFREGSDTPYELLDYPVYLLSDEDKSALESGIIVETEQEIRRLVEDICE
jgi:hypothetical protein